ncbi:MAG TPA: LPS export ABC transporter periplasmic protein LptC [Bacillota bacterium]|nr:LPS export ABC transporter periplasmic protein LptC [Bacillota bacterium]
MKLTTFFLKKSWIVISVILVIIIGLVIFWRGNQGSKKETIQVSEGVQRLQIESDQLLGLTITVPGGEKDGYWVLNFAKFTDLGTAGGLDTIEGDYYRDSKPLYHLTANSGTIHWQGQELRLNSPVVVSADQTKEISAEVMLLGPKTQNISAKRQVVVRIDDLNVRTEELVADSGLERIVLKGMTTASSK